MNDEEKLWMYAQLIGAAMEGIFKGDEAELDIETMNFTLFVTAIPYAANVLLKAYSVDHADQDHLEVTYTLNRLVHQYEVKRALAKHESGL